MPVLTLCVCVCVLIVGLQSWSRDNAIASREETQTSHEPPDLSLSEVCSTSCSYGGNADRDKAGMIYLMLSVCVRQFVETRLNPRFVKLIVRFSSPRTSMDLASVLCPMVSIFIGSLSYGKRIYRFSVLW